MSKGDREAISGDTKTPTPTLDAEVYLVKTWSQHFKKASAGVETTNSCRVSRGDEINGNDKKGVAICQSEERCVQSSLHQKSGEDSAGGRCKGPSGSGRANDFNDILARGHRFFFTDNINPTYKPVLFSNLMSSFFYLESEFSDTLLDAS